MQTILIEKGFDLYKVGMSAKELAETVLFKVYGIDISESNLPIDPFKILRESGAIYMFQDLEFLEGFYLSPDNSGVGLVSINQKRHIERQRFSAAHELCHHLKDSNLQENADIVIQGYNDPVETYANRFATELLMPRELLNKMIIERSIKPDDLDGILLIANEFGVSFQTTLIRVFDFLGHRKSKKETKKISRKFQPHKTRDELGINNQLILFKQLINSYNFNGINPPKKLKNDFLRYVISNDHAIENGKVSEERISEILTLTRFHGVTEIRESQDLNIDEMEVVGQYLMYQSIFEIKAEKPSLNVLINFHKNLYSLVPFPEFGGAYRTATARIAGTTVATTPPNLIDNHLASVCNLSDKIYTDLKNKDAAKNIEHIVRRHHEITVIHPFGDGNGRSSRGLVNYQLIQSKMPPIYILVEEKREYLEALRHLDSFDKKDQDVEPILLFMIKKIIHNFSHFIPD